MRFRTGAVLTATAVGVSLLAAAPSYANTGTKPATPTPPNNTYKVDVESTVTPPAATQSKVALTRSGSPATARANDMGLRWLLSYFPVGGTDFKVCKASNPNVKPGDDPNNVTVNYTFSKTEGSSFELKSNTPPTAPVPYCGSGWYSLYTDAVVYLPDGTPVQVDATNPEPYEFLSGKTPPKINNVLLVNPALFKIAATAATQHAGAAAAAGTAAAAANTDNKNDVQVSAVAQTLSTTLAIKEAPKLPHISLQPRGAAAAAAASGDAAAAASGDAAAAASG